MAPAFSLHCALLLFNDIFFLLVRFAPLCRSFWLTPVPVVPLLPSSFCLLTFVNIDGSSGKYILLLLDISYIPGILDPLFDAISRQPACYAEITSSSLISAIDREEEDIIAGAFNNVNKFFAVTFERVKAE